eukprot:s890_g2.t1
MVTTPNTAESLVPASFDVHVRALTVSPSLSGLGAGWTQIALEEICTSITELSTMVAPFTTRKRVVEVITIVHTSMVPPEALGFSLQDGDVMPRPHAEVIAPRSGIPLRASGSADRPMEVEEPAEVPAAEGAELPVPQRDEGPDPTEVIIDGVKLDSFPPLRTLRAACESLGLSTGGSKETCLKRLWDHLQAQELIAAHGARTQLQAELQRPVNAQPVPAEPTDKERSDHMLTRQPYAPWCELCVANRAQQDPHPQRVEASGGHSCVSFGFGYASRFDGETKACGLFIHDRDSGAMHVIPTPEKGGKYLAHLALNFAGRGDAESMEISAEAGMVFDERGLSAPVTPPAAEVAVSVAPPSSAALHSGLESHVPLRDDETGDGDRPSKHQRILRVCEHEDDNHFTFFEDAEVDDLERYDYGLKDEDEADDFSFDVSTAREELLKRLTVPYTTLEPSLSHEELLKLDLLADAVEIERLKEMGVLMPVETCDFEGQIPKRLTTRMVRLHVKMLQVKQRSLYLEKFYIPGQRNGSQMWHDSFSSLLKGVLGFEECEAYPCLLRSGGCKCLLMLHVDDVLCLSTKDYLECVLLLTLKAKYKLSCEKVEKPGDELTFLKRRHILLSDDEMAIQSHPKHLERLFDLMQINRNLKPKRTPGHPLLDEPDETAELGPSDSSTYRSCVGVLLFIASDYVECQYTIRDLSRCMSRPTVEALACLRHLCMYLLGCVDHCIVLSYKAHFGLLHYNEVDYTLEVYSDSDWAKHKTTRRSVPSGCLFLFGNLLYSTSRSQKALALSSAEAEIYAAAGACCDGVLMFHWISFAIGPELKVKFQLRVDNSAARAFFCRAGVGRIRHISLRIFWIQAKVKEQFLSVGRVDTKYNPSDIGTKRLNRDRMLHLMFLCKVYDMSSSSFVGSEVADNVKQQEVMKEGIRMFSKVGASHRDSKRLVRILLLSALGLPEVMAMEIDMAPATIAPFLFWWQVLCALLVTLLCVAIGLIFLLKIENDSLQGKCAKLSRDTMLHKLLQLMRETNEALQVRYDRREAEYDEAEIVQDEDLMYQLQNQMDEVAHLFYDI